MEIVIGNSFLAGFLIVAAITILWTVYRIYRK